MKQKWIQLKVKINVTNEKLKNQVWHPKLNHQATTNVTSQASKIKVVDPKEKTNVDPTTTSKEVNN